MQKLVNYPVAIVVSLPVPRIFEFNRNSCVHIMRPGPKLYSRCLTERSIQNSLNYASWVIPADAWEIVAIACAPEHFLRTRVSQADIIGDRFLQTFKKLQ